MINSISVSNFRGIREVKLPAMKQIVLISGKNNSGKSSLLESVFLLADHTTAECFAKINGFRNLPYLGDPDNVWAPAFHNMKTDTPIEIVAEMDQIKAKLKFVKDSSFVPLKSKDLPKDLYHQFQSSSKSFYSLKMEFNMDTYFENGHFLLSENGMALELTTSNEHNSVKPMPFTQYVKSNLGKEYIAEYFGRLELDGKKDLVVKALQIIDPDISDITAIVQKGNVQLYVKKHDRLINTRLAGDGVNQLLALLLAVISNPDSIILIDEIGTGFHYSIYNKVWKTISSAAKENHCQIIATTHSYECIAGAVEGVTMADMSDEFVYYRIAEEPNEHNKAYRFSMDMLQQAISSEMEVR